jgi:hypothetical protein
MDVFLKPARPGLIVRDPETGAALAAGGETKPRNSYWIRRINDGDAVEVTPESPAAARKGKGEQQ